MEVSIERSAGFCPGVVNAIKTAEEKLLTSKKLYCLGDIVHNAEEIKRLHEMGLEIIELNKTQELEDEEILIRSHGIPPEFYDEIKNSNNSFIDATCKIVRNLQKTIAETYKNAKAEDGQLVIFGKKDHPEVIGLNGQCNYEAIMIESKDDIAQINPDKTVFLFAQTTKDPEKFKEIVSEIRSLLNSSAAKLFVKNTICKWMINRVEKLRSFARSYDLIIFVAGRKSSNGKFLYGICKDENPNTMFISSEDEIKSSRFTNINKVGISGATSTPVWLLERIAEKISKL